MSEVRRIQAAERDLAVETAVRAFIADPMLRWFLAGDDAAWEGQAREFFGGLVDVKLGGGEAWLADAGAAIALWDPPGGCLLADEVTGPLWADIWNRVSGGAHDRVSVLEKTIHPLLPPEPHWYLGVLATHPHHRRKGLATAVLQPVLRAADRAGLPAYLETASEQNLAFYATLGFTERGDAQAGPDGPRVWVLERSPRPPVAART